METPPILSAPPADETPEQRRARAIALHPDAALLKDPDPDAEGAAELFASLASVVPGLRAMERLFPQDCDPAKVRVVTETDSIPSASRKPRRSPRPKTEGGV